MGRLLTTKMGIFPFEKLRNLTFGTFARPGVSLHFWTKFLGEILPNISRIRLIHWLTNVLRIQSPITRSFEEINLIIFPPDYGSIRVIRNSRKSLRNRPMRKIELLITTFKQAGHDPDMTFSDLGNPESTWPLLEALQYCEPLKK